MFFQFGFAAYNVLDALTCTTTATCFVCAVRNWRKNKTRKEKICFLKTDCPAESPVQKEKKKSLDAGCASGVVQVPPYVCPASRGMKCGFRMLPVTHWACHYMSRLAHLFPAYRAAQLPFHAHVQCSFACMSSEVRLRKHGSWWHIVWVGGWTDMQWFHWAAWLRIGGPGAGLDVLWLAMTIANTSDSRTSMSRRESRSIGFQRKAFHPRDLCNLHVV